MSTPRQNYIQCPCCWERFLPSQILWIAKHDELKDDYFIDSQGDKTEQKRFLPERFTSNCLAIDERGETCKRDFACPRCHMEIPESYFDCEPMYVSIVGATGAGKTFFLTALHHRLQQNRFKRDYGLDLFFDAALYAAQNKILAENVDTFFRSVVSSDTFVTLAATNPGELEMMITDPARGEYYVARPFTYILRKGGKRHAPCLYDHAGESFKGDNIEEARNTFTKHILDSDILFFLYDPTQNANCVKDYAAKYGRQIYRNGQFDEEELVGREINITKYQPIEESCRHIFAAMASFIKKYSKPNAGLINEDEQYTRYICIIVTKCDAWEKCLSEQTQQHLRKLPMARHRNDILSELRLANFNKSPLKGRLALLLELNENEDDIIAHAGERLIEMHDEIKPISVENVENHTAAVKTFVAEFKMYAQHSGITKKHREGLLYISNALKPLQEIVLCKEEDAKLKELCRRFEQVPPVDWNDKNWYQNAERTRMVYEKILQKCERTWYLLL